MQCVKARKESGLREVLILVKMKASGLQLVLSHDRFKHRRLKLVAEGVADAASGRPFVNNTANRSIDKMALARRMVVVPCFPLSSVTYIFCQMILSKLYDCRRIRSSWMKEGRITLKWRRKMSLTRQNTGPDRYSFMTGFLGKTLVHADDEKVCNHI